MFLSRTLIVLALAPTAIEARVIDDVSISGRVVLLDTSKPISGVEVVAVLQAVAGPDAATVDQTVKTDADGRFTLTFRPDREGEPRRSVTLRVRHPDYVARTSSPTSLRRLLDDHRRGERPFFETIALEPGLAYSGAVVRPDGSPADGVPFWFENWARTNPATSFWDDDKGITDAQGRFRLRMPKTQSLAIYLTPADLSPYQHFWGVDDPAKHPDEWAPADLGRIVLDRGVTLSGRALDLKGKPLPGLRLEAVGRGSRDRRSTKADVSGAFTFPPMRSGGYTVGAEGQGHGGSFDPTERTIPESSRPIARKKVVLKRGRDPAAIEIREVPTVLVSTRFVDSAGGPTSGGRVVLSGVIRGDDAQVNLPEPPGKPAVKSLASSINDDDDDDGSTRLDWGIEIEPDAEGRATFRAPKGMRHAILQVFSVADDRSKSLKTRMKPGGPLRHWGAALLETLDADVAGIEFVVYRAPTILVTVATEEGEALPEGVEVSSHFAVKGFGYGGGRFVRQKDGRYRSESLLPDQFIEVAASAQGYVQARSDRISMPEGGSGEVALTLARTPNPAKVGDLAPPFSFKTIDGKPLSLADFAGKLVLVAFWESHHNHDDIPRLKALRKRFGRDGQLAIVGLSFDFEPQDLADFVKAEGLDWPQARLGPQFNRMYAAYGISGYPTAVLIGPDGTILAKNLTGDAIGAAVEKALGK